MLSILYHSGPWGTWGRTMTQLRPAWVTWGDPATRKEKKTKEKEQNENMTLEYSLGLKILHQKCGLWTSSFSVTRAHEKLIDSGSDPEDESTLQYDPQAMSISTDYKSRPLKESSVVQGNTPQAVERTSLGCIDSESTGVMARLATPPIIKAWNHEFNFWSVHKKPEAVVHPRNPTMRWKAKSGELSKN